MVFFSLSEDFNVGSCSLIPYTSLKRSKKEFPRIFGTTAGSAGELKLASDNLALMLLISVKNKNDQGLYLRQFTFNFVNEHEIILQLVSAFTKFLDFVNIGRRHEECFFSWTFARLTKPNPELSGLQEQKYIIAGTRSHTYEIVELHVHHL